MRGLLLATTVSAALAGGSLPARASAEGGDSTWLTAGGRSGGQANGPNSAGFGVTADTRGAATADRAARRPTRDDRSAAVRTR